MIQRRISEDEVLAVLAAPHWSTPGRSVRGSTERTHFWRRLDGRLLRVTVAVADGEVVSVVAPEEEAD
jgi:hypothetical protein